MANKKVDEYERNQEKSYTCCLCGGEVLCLQAQRVKQVINGKEYCVHMHVACYDKNPLTRDKIYKTLMDLAEKDK